MSTNANNFEKKRKNSNTNLVRRDFMFSRNEKKKSAAPLFLTIGALAMIGAISITKCGKRIIHCMKEKVEGVFKKKDAEG